jgi:hypothetical protein
MSESPSDFKRKRSLSSSRSQSSPNISRTKKSSPRSDPINPAKRKKNSSAATKIMSVETSVEGEKITGTKNSSIMKVDEKGDMQLATLGDVTNVDKIREYIDSVKNIYKNNQKLSEQHLKNLKFIFEYVDEAYASKTGLQLDSWAAIETLLESLTKFCSGDITGVKLNTILDDIRFRVKRNSNVHIGTGLKEVLMYTFFSVKGLFAVSAAGAEVAYSYDKNVNGFYYQMSETIKAVSTNFSEYVGILEDDTARAQLVETMARNPIAVNLLSGAEELTTNKVFNYITNFLVRSWKLVPENLIRPIKEAIVAASEPKSSAAETLMEEGSAFGWVSNWIQSNVIGTIKTGYSMVKSVAERLYYGTDLKEQALAAQKKVFNEALKEMNNLNVAGENLSNYISYMTVTMALMTFVLSTYTLHRYLSTMQSKMLALGELQPASDEEGVIQTFGFMSLKKKSKH